jgi:hypothetical protein
MTQKALLDIYSGGLNVTGGLTIDNIIYITAYINKSYFMYMYIYIHLYFNIHRGLLMTQKALLDIYSGV